jgi:multimeric flavodoxin WrbA
MNVLMINGSPHARGTTRRALAEMEGALTAEGVETHVMTVGQELIHGCIGCGKCNGHCAAFDDIVNTAIDRMAEADGLVLATPVYFASPNGTMLAFMDRMFYAGGPVFAGKPAACVSVARRAGTTATLDVLLKYPALRSMPIVSANYWPMVHGAKASDAAEDPEGLQVMRNLGRNMAWMLKLIALGKENGLPFPAPEQPRMWTNFVR